MMFRLPAATALAVVGLLLSVAPATAAPPESSGACQITVTDLGGGFPGGGDYSAAQGINSRGDVVGVASTSNTWDPRPGGGGAALWTRDGEFIDLPSLPGDGSSEAYDINNKGTIVGTDRGTGVRHAVVWIATPDGYTITDLGKGVAYAINSSGTIVGLADGVGPAVWDSDGTMTALPTPPGNTGGWATGINDKGEIVGLVFLGGRLHTALWTPTPGGGYTFTDLGEGRANDINNAGVIVGGSQNSRALVWTPTPGGGYEVTDVSAGLINSEAYGINNAGLIVGTSSRHGGTLWSPKPGGGYTVSALPELGAGGNTAARDINEAGQAAGQSRTEAGRTHAVRWDGIRRGCTTGQQGQ